MTKRWFIIQMEVTLIMSLSHSLFVIDAHFCQWERWWRHQC